MKDQTEGSVKGFREIQFGSAHYEDECKLRNEVLRTPLGLSLWDEDLSAESAQWHFGLFDEKGVLQACGVVQVLTTTTVKLRQVAVKSDRHRSGVGTSLMEGIERTLLRKDFTQVILHSRTTARGFYEKLGYRVEGDEFEEVGLPHQRMSKELPRR